MSDYEQQFRDAGLTGKDLDAALKLMSEINDDRTKLCKLILVGNRLARGQATVAEWHDAVKAVTPAPMVCSRE